MNDVGRISSTLPDVPPFACWREKLRQPNPREKKLCPHSRPVQRGPGSTFPMSELSGFTSPSDAMPMRYAFPDMRRHSLPSKKMLILVQISRTGSRKSRRVRAHQRKPLRDFDTCYRFRQAR